MKTFSCVGPLFDQHVYALPLLDFLIINSFEKEIISGKWK